jgi:hypothetical protein
MSRKTGTRLDEFSQTLAMENSQCPLFFSAICSMPASAQCAVRHAYLNGIKAAASAMILTSWFSEKVARSKDSKIEVR